MTTFTASTDLPTNINTLEKLAAWVGQALTRCNPSLKVLELANAQPSRAAEAVLIKADDNSFRLVVRMVLPISDDYAAQTRKFWENAQEFSNTALPAAFKVN